MSDQGRLPLPSPPESAEEAPAMRVADVAVFVPLSQAYSFSIPPELEGSVVPGARVVCGFRNRQVLGVVLEVGAAKPTLSLSRLKPVLGVVDVEPVVPQELLGFLRELSAYYLAPIGEVMRLAVPAVERSRAKALASRGLVGAGRVPAVGRTTAYAEPHRAEALDAGTQRELEQLRGQALAVWQHLTLHGATAVADLARRWGNARAAVKKLQALGAVERTERVHVGGATPAGDIERDVPPELNPAQLAAVEAIEAGLASQEPHAFLLYGVTASGKTEVYLRAVQSALERGGSALVLVPEIALTPQLVGRFRARLGDTIAVLHSGLTESQRYGTWQRLRSGELRVAVGARSALFAPLSKLALVCVDEEQDGSFKQEEGVRYNARDMALLRAHRARAACVLGSATPSLKSFFAVSAGKLSCLELPRRARDRAVLPETEVVDLRRVGPGPSGEPLLSLPLCRAIESTLSRGEQAILFLNRRGFAPSVCCDACGTVLSCPSCEVALTYHRTPRPHVVCHYCGYEDAPPGACSDCKAPRLSYEGVGTERIEAMLAEAFPKARVARLDRDTGAGLKSERVLESMQRREVDVLVGTQMVTKGHDLPGVTLVGVLNADAALSMPDYQAAERTFQLLVQVAGRAGRGEKPGKVLIQTRNPRHPAVRLALAHDVSGFVKYGLSDRRELGYPPYVRLALVRVSAMEDRVAREGAARLASAARRHAGQRAEVLGPSPAPIVRLRSRYRHRVMVRSSSRAALRQVLRAVLAEKVDPRLRRIVDVDPVSML